MIFHKSPETAQTAIIIIGMAGNYRDEKKGRLLIRGWFLLTLAAGCAAFYSLTQIGEASLHSVFLGYSASRLLMMAAVLLWCLFVLAGFLDPGNKFTSLMLKASGSVPSRSAAVLLFLLLSGVWICGGFLAEESFLPFFERIRPLLLLGMLVSGTGALMLYYLHSASYTACKEQRSVRRFTAVLFLIACGIYLLIRITGIGIVPDEMDWQPTGMAVQYWELYLSAWIALSMSLFLHLIRAYRDHRLTTLILFLMIWAGTAVLWVSIPTADVLEHSYFMEITAPDYLPYPASDAANFGLWAESILAGFGFKTTIAYRQFLCTVLAFFEALTNRDILRTIDCLTITLALIPACLYLLGKRLHSHGAGILAAGLAVMREYNTIWLAPHFMVSDSKMWLSDLPAMLCLLAAVCAMADWFQKPRSLWRMLLAGCLMGLCVTIRSQFIVLIPFPALIFLLRKGLNFREKMLRAAGFVLAALLVTAPWFIRSRIITGDFILDEPGVHSTELARRWSDDVNNVVVREPGESDADYAARNKQHMIDFFLEKPLYVLRFTASHFVANEIVALTALPFGTNPELTVRDVTDTGFHDVETRLLSGKNVPVLLLFLAVIAAGMAAARERAGWAGMLPFVMCSLYLGSTAAARYSGWRFALPADWFFYFYFALGLAELAFQIACALGLRREKQLPVPATDISPQPLRPAVCAAILVLFLILGAAPALSGRLVPEQYPMKTTAENISDLESLTADYPAEQEAVARLLDRSDRVVLNGRAVYPRYFVKNEGLASGHPWIAYRIRDFGRLGFVLLNKENHDIILPLEEEPGFIGNAADVYVIGADDEQGFFRADAVIIPQNELNGAPRILISDKEE